MMRSHGSANIPLIDQSNENFDIAAGKYQVAVKQQGLSEDSIAAAVQHLRQLISNKKVFLVSSISEAVACPGGMTHVLSLQGELKRVRMH